MKTYTIKKQGIILAIVPAHNFSEAMALFPTKLGGLSVVRTTNKLLTSQCGRHSLKPKARSSAS